MNEDQKETWKAGSSTFSRFVDNSSNDDFSVETIIEKKEDGTFVIVSVNILPRKEEKHTFRNI